MSDYRRQAMRKIYRLLGAVEHWILRRFTPAGKLVLAAIVISAVVGVDTKQSMAYQVFTFSTCLLAASVAWAFFFKARVTASRTLPRFCTAGTTLQYRITVENHSRDQQRGLEVIEDYFEIQFLPGQDGLTAQKGGQGSSGSPGKANRRFLSRSARRGRFTLAPLPHLEPGSQAEVRLEITPRRRGRLYFRTLQVACPDPLGLFRAIVPLPVEQSLLVLPRRYQVPDLSLVGTRKYQSGGVALASSIGDSGEFIGLREYRPGDPLRRIHWKSWAKVGKPIVKEYQDEFFVRHALVLDTFMAADTSRAFEEAVSLAASFACAVDTQESLLDLMFVGLQSYCFTSGRGVDHIDRMLEILASVRTCQVKPFSELPAMVLEKSPALSSCICIFLEWDAQRKAFVERLQSIGVPVMALVVTGEDEAAPKFETTVKDVYRLQAGHILEGLGQL